MYLHRNGKVSRRVRRELDLDLLLAEGRLVGYRRNFDNVEARFSGCARGKAEEVGRLRVALKLELHEARSVTFNRLRDLLLLTVQLHRANDSVVLQNQEACTILKISTGQTLAAIP